MADFLVAQRTPPKSMTAIMAIRGAFTAGVIEYGDSWIAAGDLRHALSHTYSVNKRDEALATVAARYLPRFVALREVMLGYADE